MFVAALDQVPDEYEVEGPDPNYWVLTLLAVSEDEVRDVAVRTLLMPFTHDGYVAYELKFEIVIADDRAQRAVEAILGAAKTGKIGDGKIFVSEVEEAVRIRTGERGTEAL